MNDRRYALVTPVRDECQTIARTIRVVLAQTIRPATWVIVDDGSTDGTDQVILEYTRKHTWISLVSLPTRAQRSFAAVVENTMLGVRLLPTELDYLGLLDGDVLFQPDYFEELIRRFEENPRLGLAGGVVIDEGHPRRPPRNRQDVPGAVQFYRRDCFEALDGLCPVPEGGWDALACAGARLAGWQTELVTDLYVEHLKPRNVSQGGPLRRKWQMGCRDYAMGYLPMFELLKCLGRLSAPPLLVGSAAWWLGYCAAAMRRRPRVVAPQLLAQVQREQRDRMTQMLRI